MSSPKRIVVQIPRPTSHEADDDYRTFVARLRGLVSEGYKEIVVDLAAVTLADSVLLGAIANAYASATRQGATLTILRATPSFRELLHVTKLERILKIADSDAEV